MAKRRRTKIVKVANKYSKTGRTIDFKRDKSLNALKPGLRKPFGKKPYWESRENRSDF